MDLLTIVEEMRPDIIGLLQQLIAIPSENPPGDYVEIAAFLQRLLTERGFQVVVHTPDDHAAFPRRNVVATLRGTRPGKTLILNAHMDTVPAQDLTAWTHPPFAGTRADGKVFGRGATDCKGRLAAYVMAVFAVQRLSPDFAGNVVLALTCDEETGGHAGVKYLVENHHLQGDAVLIEGYSDEIVRAIASALHLRITSRGVAAHSGYKWRGVNAIENMSQLIQKLTELQGVYQQSPSSIPGMGCTTINVGMIEGGSKLNIVPSHCTIDVDIRITPEHSVDEILERVRELVDSVRQENPSADFLLERVEDFPSESVVVEEDEPLIQDLQRAVQCVRGDGVPVVGMMGQTDAVWFAKKGIPSVHFGPGSRNNNLHGVDEWMDEEDLIQSTKIVAHFIVNYLQAVEQEASCGLIEANRPS